MWLYNQGQDTLPYHQEVKRRAVSNWIWHTNAVYDSTLEHVLLAREKSLCGKDGLSHTTALSKHNHYPNYFVHLPKY